MLILGKFVKKKLNFSKCKISSKKHYKSIQCIAKFVLTENFTSLKISIVKQENTNKFSAEEIKTQENIPEV